MKITTDEFLLRIKIEEVLEKHGVKNYVEIATDIAKIFLQPDVSSNEAHPKENKKLGGVAVCEHCGFQPMIKVNNEYECEMCGNTQKAN